MEGELIGAGGDPRRTDHLRTGARGLHTEGIFRAGLNTGPLGPSLVADPGAAKARAAFGARLTHLAKDPARVIPSILGHGFSPESTGITGQGIVTRRTGFSAAGREAQGQDGGQQPGDLPLGEPFLLHPSHRSYSHSDQDAPSALSDPEPMAYP